MAKYYKLLNSFDNTLFSFAAGGKAAVNYGLDQVINAPNWLAEKGYHLCVYSDLFNVARLATGIMKKMSAQLWEVEAEECESIPKPACLIELDWGIIRSVGTHRVWPIGTRMVKNLRLIRQVTDEELRAAVAEKRYYKIMLELNGKLESYATDLRVGGITYSTTEVNNASDNLYNEGYHLFAFETLKQLCTVFFDKWSPALSVVYQVTGEQVDLKPLRHWCVTPKGEVLWTVSELRPAYDGTVMLKNVRLVERVTTAQLEYVNS